MTLVRFWSLTAVSAFILLWQKSRGMMPLTPLSMKNKYLWVSVVLMVCISLSTYMSLQGTRPLSYTIPMTAAGVIISSIVNRRYWKSLIVTWTLVIGGICLLIAGTVTWSNESILYTLFAVLSYSGFSLVSDRYKREENVVARLGQFFFVLSALCAILTLPLVFVSTLDTYPAHVIVQMILFSLALVALPYYVFYYFLTSAATEFVLRYSFLVIFTTMLAQIVLFGTTRAFEPVTLGAAALVMAGAALPQFIMWNRQNMRLFLKQL